MLGIAPNGDSWYNFLFNGDSQQVANSVLDSINGTPSPASTLSSVMTMGPKVPTLTASGDLANPDTAVQETFYWPQLTGSLNNAIVAAADQMNTSNASGLVPVFGPGDNWLVIAAIGVGGFIGFKLLMSVLER